jgi:predicted DNA-binding transcriptional regulator AlpA
MLYPSGNSNIQPWGDEAIMQKQYLNEKEVATLTGRSVHSIRKDRLVGKGFPYVKLGRSIFYIEEDVHKTMAAHRVEPQPRG